jgi:putative oxidoreductase
MKEGQAARTAGLIGRGMFGGLAGAGVAASGTQSTGAGPRARSRDADFVVALLEDTLAIGGGLLIVSGSEQMRLQLAQFADLSLLLMRLMVAAVFATSGWTDITNPKERAKSIGMTPVFTVFLGVAELAGGTGVAFGVLAQLAAIGLILVGLGAIYEKIVEWYTGIWGEKASGWHYDLMLLLMNVVIACTGGGTYVLWK